MIDQSSPATSVTGLGFGRPLRESVAGQTECKMKQWVLLLRVCAHPLPFTVDVEN